MRLEGLTISTRTILSVFFDGQFWVAEIERHREGRIETARHCFGAEPSNARLLEWVDRELPRLQFHAEPVRPEPAAKSISPKRAKRIAAAEVAKTGFSSRAQEAMRIALKDQKKERRSEKQRRSEEERKRLWTLHQRKLKERHRGH